MWRSLVLSELRPQHGYGATAQMPFENHKEVYDLYDYIRSTWPYWNESVSGFLACTSGSWLSRARWMMTGTVILHLNGEQVKKQETRHFITLTCDHGPRCALRYLTGLENALLVLDGTGGSYLLRKRGDGFALSRAATAITQTSRNTGRCRTTGTLSSPPALWGTSSGTVRTTRAAIAEKD